MIMAAIIFASDKEKKPVSSENEEKFNSFKIAEDGTIVRINETKTCLGCQKTFSDEMSFCSYCGKKIVRISEIQTCSQCNKIFSNDEKFCSECGDKLVKLTNL